MVDDARGGGNIGGMMKTTALMLCLSVFGCYGSEEWECGCTDEQVAAAEASPGLEVCEDGMDNDGDGLTDCEDPVCCAVCCNGEPTY